MAGSKYLKSLQEHLRFLGFANSRNDNTSQGAFNPFQADVPLLFPLSQSMDWFLYNIGLRHERVKFSYITDEFGLNRS